MKLGSLSLTCTILCLFFASCHDAAVTVPDGCIGDMCGFPDSAACNADYECDSNVCTNGVCGPSSGVALGQPCSYGECVADATCVNSVCVPKSSACGSDGEPCEDDADCCGAGICSANVCTGDSSDGGAGGAGSSGAGGSGGGGGDTGDAGSEAPEDGG
jgi:hypothetical protein